MTNQRLKGALCGCLSAITYGTNPIFARYLYREGFDAGGVLFYRFFFGIVLLGAFMLFIRRRRLVVGRHDWPVLAGLGLAFAVSSLTYFESFHYMSSGVAATLVFAYPVFVALIMATCYGERLAWPTLLAIALTVGGIALLYKDDSGQPIAWQGIVLILISALTYALYIIIINRSRLVMPGIDLTFMAMLFCLGFLTVYQVAMPGAHFSMLETPLAWTSALMLGLLPTVISLVTMAVAVRCIGSTPTALMGALEPVTATVLGILLFSEPLTERLVAGICLILCAVGLILLDNRLRHVLSIGRVRRRGRLLFKRARWR